MIKTLARIESKVSQKYGEDSVEKIGHFYLDHDTTIDTAKLMVLDFLKYLSNLEDQVKAQQAAKETENPVSGQTEAASELSCQPGEICEPRDYA